MSQKENDKRLYSADDFERYHSGKMPEQEMNALEKAALDDPFLSDALDGYQNTKTATADIDELRNKLFQKEDNKKIIWFRRKPVNLVLRIAAVLILISGAGLILYKNKAVEKKEVAVINNKNIPSDNLTNKVADSITSKQPESDLATAVETKKQSLTLTQDKFLSPAKKKELVIVSTKPNTYLNQTQSGLTTDSIKRTDQFYSNTEAAPTGEVNNALAGKVAGIQIISQNKNTPITIKGRITDTAGNPVSFATVTDKKNKIGVTSGVEGTFAFKSKDSFPQVDINAIGYKTTLKKLSNDSSQNNLVVLEKENSLNEVVVTSAYGTKRSKRESAFKKTSSNESRIQRISVTNAIPVNGWQDFNKYVNDSLKTLKQLGSLAVSSEISVSFTINDIGQPVDISAEDSSCSSCNEEAIRIIKNSPPWKLNKKYKKAHAIIRF